MKERKRSRGWYHFALVAVLALGLAAPAGLLLNMALPAPASANEELHPGGRLFYPAWDVRGARLSFMIITRMALFPQDQDSEGAYISTGQRYDTHNNCLPGHTTAFPGLVGTTGGVFSGLGGPGTLTDDVHLEWYGKSCEKDDEIIKMSCADIDLIFLSSANLAGHYGDTQGDKQGSLDVHFIINGTNFRQRVHENSLMGNAIIADPTEGWALAYPAAAAKATYCFNCGRADGGSRVGYEAFPIEVFIPWVLADDSQGGLQNLLYLWGPTFFPADDMPDQLGLNWLWWDGRERRFTNSKGRHAFVDLLKNLDPLFKHSTFTCGHTVDPVRAENDGAPRTDVNGTDATGGCSGNGAPDTVHTSDNAQTGPAFSSTSIGWWDILKVSETPTPFPNLGTVIQKRGLVGVVASTIPGANTGNGDSIRLWHKDPCSWGPQKGIGPPHLRDRNFGNGNRLVGFNLYNFDTQVSFCAGGGVVDTFPGGSEGWTDGDGSSGPGP